MKGWSELLVCALNKLYKSYQKQGGTVCISELRASIISTKRRCSPHGYAAVIKDVLQEYSKDKWSYRFADLLAKWSDNQYRATKRGTVEDSGNTQLGNNAKAARWLMRYMPVVFDIVHDRAPVDFIYEIYDSFCRYINNVLMGVYDNDISMHPVLAYTYAQLYLCYQDKNGDGFSNNLLRIIVEDDSDVFFNNLLNEAEKEWLS